jgi:hypothetical protein
MGVPSSMTVQEPNQNTREVGRASGGETMRLDADGKAWVGETGRLGG